VASTTTEVHVSSVRKPEQVQIQVKKYETNSKGVPVVVTHTVEVSKPRNEAELAKSFEKVLKAVDDVRFDDAGNAAELAKAVLCQTSQVHLSSPKGVPIANVEISGVPEADIAKVVSAMEEHLGYDVVDEFDLAAQLAELAESAKANCR
jgi:hypothetical protein